jgi:predicted alpha/beta-fold hydrolase
VKLRQPLKYDRECFTLSDGGTIGLDWHIDDNGGRPRPDGRKLPILALVSGLSGGNDNLYLFSMIKAASAAGFKCVVINFRGASGVPLTSGLIYWMNLWQDVQEPIDYIHSTYCVNNREKVRNLYAYAVSLGASLLGSYLAQAGDKSPLKGACCFGTPYCLQENVPFFKTNGFKFYDFSMGYFFYKSVLNPAIP